MSRTRDVELVDICARLTVVRGELAHLLEHMCHRPVCDDAPDATHPAADDLIDIALLSVDAAIEALTEVATAGRLQAADTSASGPLN